MTVTASLIIGMIIGTAIGTVATVVILAALLRKALTIAHQNPSTCNLPHK